MAIGIAEPECGGWLATGGRMSCNDQATQELLDLARENARLKDTIKIMRWFLIISLLLNLLQFLFPGQQPNRVAVQPKSFSPRFVKSFLQFRFGFEAIVDERPQRVRNDSLLWCAAMRFAEVYQIACEGFVQGQPGTRGARASGHLTNMYE
jgi:hypothetical protein